MKLIIAFILSFNIALANDVKVVKKGEVVPFDGVLFTKELEKDIRNDIQILNKKVDTLTKINDINEKELNIVNKRLALYQNKADELTKREVKSERDSLVKNTLYFLSGALLTGIIGYGVIKAYR
jgi:hypothetical protein